MAKKPFYKNITSMLGFFLLAILIASFAFWGTTGLGTQQGAVVASVGDQKVTIAEFVNVFDSEVSRYREQLGPEFDRQQALVMGLDRAVISQLVQRAALDQEVEDLGLSGSNQAVRDRIQGMEVFHDLSGKFSDFLYTSRLKGARLSVEEFEGDIRVDLARAQLIDGLTQTAILPATLLETIYDYRKESRRAEIATIPASTITDFTPPDAETIQAFYDRSTTMFYAPEFRNLTFMIVDPSLFAHQAEFSDEEIAAEYDFRYEEFNVPEQRTLAVAILAGEDQARELFSRVQAGEDFTALASEMNGFTADELSIGERTRSEVFSEYGEVAAARVFTASLDGVTEPTQSLHSWQVFHITAITPGDEHTLDEVRPELIQLMAEEQGIDDLYNAVALVDDEIASGSTLDQISVAAGIPLIRVEATSRQAQDPDGALIPETQVYPYLAHAFAIDNETPLELYQVEGSDVFYLIGLGKITPPAPRPLEAIEDQVRQAWTIDEQLRLAREHANQALAEVEAGATLAEVAAKYGGISFEIGSYRRDRVFTQRELAPGIASLMFSLPLGGAGVEADARGDGYLIMKVSEIKSQDPANDQFEYQALVATLKAEMENDIFIQLQAAIQNDLDIDVNYALVNTYFDPNRQTSASPF